MLDRERILARLLDLERYSRRLDDLLPESLEMFKAADYVLKAAAERLLQLISDIELEISTLVYKGKKLELTGEESRLLERVSGILGPKITEGVRIRRILRNKLIHQYADVSYDEEVYAQAGGLKDVYDFRKAVERLLKNEV